MEQIYWGVLACFGLMLAYIIISMFLESVGFNEDGGEDERSGC